MEFIKGEFFKKSICFKGNNLNKTSKENNGELKSENKKTEAEVLNALSSYNQAFINFKGNSKEYDKKIKEFVEKANKEGDSYFNLVLPEINRNNIDLAEKLCFGKDDNGKDLFSEKEEIWLILAYTDEYNIDLAEKLCFSKKANGRDMFFDKSEIWRILISATKDSVHLAEKLCFGKDDNGKDLFSDKSEVENILLKINKDNLNLAEKLCFGKDDNGKDLFSEKEEITDILSKINKDNIDLAEKLCFGKDDNGKELFSKKSEIKYILSMVDEDNFDLVEKLCFGKDDNGKDLFPEKKEIKYILPKINKNNINLAEKITVATDEKGKVLFSENREIKRILLKTTEDNIDLAEKLCIGKDDNGKEYFSEKALIPDLLQSGLTQEKIEELIALCKDGELSYDFIPVITKDKKEFSIEKYKAIQNAIKQENIRNLSPKEIEFACNMACLCGKNSINEIELANKKEILRCIVSENIGLFEFSKKIKKAFPLIPKNQEQYCSLVSGLAKSIGVETNELTKGENEIFNNSIKNLSLNLASLSDTEFNDLEFKQEYTKDDFIIKIFNLVKDLEPKERQKVYDYFGFELKENQNGTIVNDNIHKKFSIIGYPVNLHNGKKLVQIDNIETKKIVEKVRQEVIKFSENNYVTCSNCEIEKDINDILNIFPEIRTEIDKIQHGAHEFDVFKHSLKVMQKIAQNPEFEKLNDSDKKIMLMASMLHDITKNEGLKDITHASESAFDGIYISKKLDLSRDEEIKLHSLIKNHEWLGYLNNNSNEDKDKQVEKLKSVAYDLQYDNLFEMSKIFTEADLKAVKADDGFYNKFENIFNEKSRTIESYIRELKVTQPFLPVTKIPSASRIKKAITQVNSDGSTNLAGIYQDKKGMIIIRYNEVENETWEKIGFKKGSVSKGIKSINFKNEEVDTGNIKFYAHGLDENWQLQNFDAFQFLDSDALLSASYMELPENKYRLFRNYGVLLNVDTKYQHGGGNTDAGSGYKKDLNSFKKEYAYKGSFRYKDRTYVSDLIKETLQMTDEQYLEFIKINANKSIPEIKPEEYQKKLVDAFATINSNKRRGDREYNEMYITNPSVMGVFSYPLKGDLSNFSEFIESQPKFLQKYALEQNIPFIVFGD